MTDVPGIIPLLEPRFCVAVPGRTQNAFEETEPSAATILAHAYALPLCYYRIDIVHADSPKRRLTVFTDKWGELRFMVTPTAKKARVEKKDAAFVAEWILFVMKGIEEHGVSEDGLFGDFYLHTVPYDPGDTDIYTHKTKNHRLDKYPGYLKPTTPDDPRTDPSWQRLQPVDPQLVGQHFDLAMRLAEWREEWEAGAGVDSDLEPEWVCPAFKYWVQPFFVERPEWDKKIKVCGKAVDVGWPVVRWDQAGSRPGRYGNPLTLMGDDMQHLRTEDRKDLAGLQAKVKAKGGVVLHWDGSYSAQGGCKKFRRSGKKYAKWVAAGSPTGEAPERTGTHFFIDNDGTIYQVMDPRYRTIHASDHNSLRIGIDFSSLASESSIRKYRMFWDGALDCRDDPMESKVVFPNRWQQGTAEKGKNTAPRRGGGSYMDFYRVQYKAAAALVKALASEIGFELSHPSQGRLLAKLSEEDRQEPHWEARLAAQEEAVPLNRGFLKELNDSGAGGWGRRVFIDPDHTPLYIRVTNAQDSAKSGVGKDFPGVVCHMHIAWSRSDAGPLFDWPTFLDLVGAPLPSKIPT